MIENGNQVPMKFFFGAPSCVPATGFETSGAVLSPAEVEVLPRRPDIRFLSEMMNFPGVVHDDPGVMAKITSAKNHGKPVDGHAPGLRGKDLEKYAGAGIRTDHECSEVDEAVEKIDNGMIIQIREGSAARNFENLWPLIDAFPDKIMLCSDDLHPDDLITGHLNRLLSRGIQKGVNLFNLLRAISVNPVEHYHLTVGLAREGDPADLVVVDNLENFGVLSTYIQGKRVYHAGELSFSAGKQDIPNRFVPNHVAPADLRVPAQAGKIHVIGAVDGELFTRNLVEDPTVKSGYVVSDPSRDILKIAVVNRYEKEKPAVGFIHHMGLPKGRWPHPLRTTVIISSLWAQRTGICSN